MSIWLIKREFKINNFKINHLLWKFRVKIYKVAYKLILWKILMKNWADKRELITTVLNSKLLVFNRMPQSNIKFSPLLKRENSILKLNNHSNQILRKSKYTLQVTVKIIEIISIEAKTMSKIWIMIWTCNNQISKKLKIHRWIMHRICILQAIYKINHQISIELIRLELVGMYQRLRRNLDYQADRI